MKQDNYKAPSLREIWYGAKKPENVWFLIYYGISSFVVYGSSRLGVSPNALTMSALFTNVCSFVMFVFSSDQRSQLVSIVLFNVAHIFDCSDGHLAYVCNLRSKRGAWLDSSLDVFKIGMITVCLIMLVEQAETSAHGYLDPIFLTLSIGPLVSYAVSMASIPYQRMTDAYREKRISLYVRSDGVLSRLFIFVVSNVREYGNLLVVMVLLVLLPKVGLLGLVVVGGGQLLMGMARILRVSKMLTLESDA
jgi:phosphatidylglycerophosphate synthase